MKPKYSFEIDVSGTDYETCTGQWAGYNLIVCEGNTLDELLENASVDASDQDGGEIYCGPADSAWMQDLIIDEYDKALRQACRYHDDSGSCDACMERYNAIKENE